ncbi:DUF2254 domain-containing protein [Alkalihalobacillus sp. MEB130]|uniref:DUF2254 domain-containing protein n=1 Tax=Alkalihalobacillus sp. MEB130 TaxID=2976704 RepID=UPI0028DE5695|nr:DUF2254 domain-containing protein [Alkalihalobacillus sp. MEB130]MDT8861129.1 DUF2254 domain-containing protein [Alkalihalobacillus sp. MEB130]
MKDHPTWLMLRSHFWFIPAVYGITSILFAWLSVYVDYLLRDDFFPPFFVVDLNLAHTLLSTIASSLLTMTTISFSTIMVVLTTYLSQFSPRTMQDFLTDVHTQRILGVFIGGFVYALILLLLIRETDQQSFFLAPTLAVLYAIVCVGFFVFFVHHVGRWIQVSNLIHHITRSTIQSIHSNYEDEEIEARDEPWKDWESEELTLIEPTYIFAEKSGYLLIVEIEKLVEQARDDDVIVKVEVGLGDFIEKGTTILSFWGKNTSEIDSSLYQQLFHVGEERATIQDIDFGLTKLVEITLRALSPGTNDPNTAISGIRALARILTVLAKKNLHRSYYNDQYESLRVMVKQRHFEDYLYRCYYQIRHYGIEDVSVVAAMIDSLQLIAAQNDRRIKEIVWQFSRYIQQGIKQETMLELDRSYINEKVQQLAIQTEHAHDHHPL